MDNGAELAATARDAANSHATSEELKRLIDPKPLVENGHSWTAYVGPLVSLAILAAALYQLRGLNFAAIRALVPTHPLFWLVFAATYLLSPIADWVIFRKLWGLPVSGMAALLRKYVCNEILLGYLGEVYFYAWARRHVRKVAAPFGAIKDVTILSALTGNVATLAMVLLAAPMIGRLHLGVDSTTFALSMSFVLGTSMIFLLLRQSLFTLPPADLWFITFIHLVRIFGWALLTGLTWHLVLPGVSIIYWLLLSTMRQLLSRLPFLPNKDVMFVALAAFLVGRETEIVNVMALIATLMVSAHLLVGTIFGLTGLIREKTD